MEVSSGEHGDGVSADASLEGIVSGCGGFSFKKLGAGSGVRYARGPRNGSVSSGILHLAGGADRGCLAASAILPTVEGAAIRL